MPLVLTPYGALKRGSDDSFELVDVDGGMKGGEVCFSAKRDRRHPHQATWDHARVTIALRCVCKTRPCLKSRWP